MQFGEQASRFAARFFSWLQDEDALYMLTALLDLHIV